MREKLADEYGNSYREPRFEAYPDAVIIAEIDESADYEVDQTAILRDEADGTFILACASGCSCWDGDWQLARYDSLDELFADIGPDGKSDYDFNPSFTGVESLRTQADEWYARADLEYGR